MSFMFHYVKLMTKIKEITIISSVNDVKYE
jgi:hypothetical protein